jgi:ethanolamine utilization protein EutN
MLIGRVIGNVVATQKAPSHEGRNRGDVVLALDAVDAGVGDRVLIATEGFSAMTAVGQTNAPIDAAVVGVIDAVDVVEGVK